MRQLLVSINALLLALLLAGCAEVMDGKTKGEEAVAAFHENFNASKFDAIVAMAGTDITSTTEPGQFATILGGMREQLGPVQSSERTSFNVNMDNGVSTVELLYDTKFANAERKEEFVWKIKDEKIQLAGWHVSDPNAPEDAAPAEEAAE